ncbi:MAG: hypothetical protein AB4352_13695 [Hormoscilla sp.]
MAKLVEIFQKVIKGKQTILSEAGESTNQILSKLSFSPITALCMAITTIVIGLTLANHKSGKIVKNSDDICQQFVKNNATVDRAQIQQLQFKEGVKKAVIREILGEPYCLLPKAAIRAGAIAESEVYQSSENYRLIVAYENDQYIGYGIEGDRSAEYQPRRKQIEVEKVWGIEAGKVIAGQRVIGGLGDISLEFKGIVKAPLTGYVEGKFVLVTEEDLIEGTKDCIIFYSPQMPAYLLKICGLTRRNLGPVDRGSPIGETGGKLHISLLSFRKVADQTNKWIYVSPSETLIEQLVR